MATSRILILACLLMSVAAWSRETATPAACQAAAAQPSIAKAKAALERNPDDLRANFNLADAWSDAGCFNDAMQVLLAAQALHSGNGELETRLRVAKSLVGEEHFFDNLDRANDEAKFKRDIFRCNTLSDLEACSEAVRLKSDDPAVLIAQGDALLRERRPADALIRYRRAAALAPNQPDVAVKITAAEAQLPPAAPAATVAADAKAPPTNAGAPALKKTLSELRVASSGPAPVHRYSNAAPEAQSH